MSRKSSIYGEARTAYNVVTGKPCKITSDMFSRSGTEINIKIHLKRNVLSNCELG
jgi:hypothetical protein